MRDLLPTDDGIIGVGETEVEFTLGERLISPGEFAGYFQTDGKISFARNVLGGLVCAKSGDGHFISIGSNVEKFSADGSTIWTFENSGLSVSSDADGKVYVCGQFYKTRNFTPHLRKVAVRRMLHGKLGDFAPNSPPSGLSNSTFVMVRDCFPLLFLSNQRLLTMIWGYSPVSFFVKDFPDNEFFEFNGDGELFPVGILDFEERQSYKLFIEVHDGKGGIWTGEISVMVPTTRRRMWMKTA